MIEHFDFARLHRIGLSAPIAQQLAALQVAHPEPQLMRVAEVQRDALTLNDGEQEHPARALPALLLALADAADALAVGDWVLAGLDPHHEWWVHARVPPLTQIARRLHDGREKVTRTVIVSNVDTALLVMGLDHDFSLRRLERYLALVRLSGVSAVVVLTKADLCADVPARQRAAQALLPPDTALVSLNALAADARVPLLPWLHAGRTLVLLGSSGTGKSTLTNALLGAEVQRVGDIRRGDGRGRHTTTTRSLHVTTEGACVIDTPGLRTLRLDSEAGEIDAVFQDIAQLALQCRFRDCRHDAEPGCAVRSAVAAERLGSWRKLTREARSERASAQQRKLRLAQWKARARDARARSDAKRGQ